MNTTGFKGPLTYKQALIELDCSLSSLHRMMNAGTVIREYFNPPKGMPRVFIPTDPAYYQPRTAGGKEASWQNSTSAQGRQTGGHRTRIPAAARQLENLLKSHASRD